MEHIQLRMAVVAAFFASSVSQEFYDKFHFRIIIKYPSGSDGAGNRWCQSEPMRMPIRMDIGLMSMSRSGMLQIFRLFKFFLISLGIPFDILRTYHTEKSFKFLLVLQQRCK